MTTIPFCGLNFCPTAVTSFSWRPAGGPQRSGIYVGSIDSNQRWQVGSARSSAVYAPPGHLLFIENGTLVAQPFDARRLFLDRIDEDAAKSGGGHSASKTVEIN